MAIDFVLAFPIARVVQTKSRKPFRIEYIDGERLRIRPLASQHKVPVSVELKSLSVVIERYAEVDPRRIVDTINAILKSADAKVDHVTEGYMYALARDYWSQKVRASQSTSEGEILPEESEQPVRERRLLEGAPDQRWVNVYERNQEARKLCIAHYKPVCSVCAFKFVNVYGPIGANFIHVHHLKPVASLGKEYVVDPTVDLRPVCPNCHAMLHISGELRSIEKLKALMEKASS